MSRIIDIMVMPTQNASIKMADTKSCLIIPPLGNNSDMIEAIIEEFTSEENSSKIYMIGDHDKIEESNVIISKVPPKRANSGIWRLESDPKEENIDQFIIHLGDPENGKISPPGIYVSDLNRISINPVNGGNPVVAGVIVENGQYTVLISRIQKNK